MTRASASASSGAHLVHRTCHTAESNDPLSTAVASALAAADDVDPTVTQWSLTDFVDPEALDSLFVQYRDDTDGYCRFEFAADCYRVVVESDGSISVYREDC